MEKGDISRTRLISVACDLILDRGFSAMTVASVCAAAQVTKGSFFHHFASKEALGEAVLKQFWDAVSERQARAGYQSLADPVARLFGYITHAIETYRDPVLRNGCLLAVYTLELRETHPEIYRQCVPYFSDWRDSLVSMIREAAIHAGSEPGCDCRSWAELYIATLEGALILAKAMDDPDVITRCLTLYQTQLQVALGISRSE